MNNEDQIKYPEKGSSRLRLGRWSGSGRVYFLTTRILNRQDVFRSNSCCEIVFNSIEWLEANGRWEYYCVMIMPDHVHIVAELKQSYKLEQLMHSWKRYSAREINELKGWKGRLWKEGYHDHGIRKEESLWEIILYCYYNPVRKGLVQKPSEYPFWRCKYNLK